MRVEDSGLSVRRPCCAGAARSLAARAQARLPMATRNFYVDGHTPKPH